jgi:hypothetical protein
VAGGWWTGLGAGAEVAAAGGAGSGWSAAPADPTPSRWGGISHAWLHREGGRGVAHGL